MAELLAPVGSFPALVAAVESSADAVYLAGKSFGARAYAPNFSDEELVQAIRFAHLRGVLVYVTVNTLVDDTEVPLLIEYLRYLYEQEVDAIIVQDIGVAKIARETVPGLPLHASTQMTIHNLDGVQMAAELGFKRVVLARELSLAEIQYICANTNIEIEVFIHGALCICYSGQCLMSSMIGGRSGNRGRCAQPCRLPYTLVDEKGDNLLEKADVGEYLLSPKDLNTLDIIPELLKAGVCSLKIEGRMKRPEYVAVVVQAYRQAIQHYQNPQVNDSISEQDKKELAQIFNREFTTAYLLEKSGRQMMSDRRPNNRGVRIGRVINYHHEKRIAVIKLDELLSKGDIIDFWVKVGGRVNKTVSTLTIDGIVVEQAPAGAEVAIPIPSAVRTNDRVFKVFDARLMEKARSYFSGSIPVRRIQVQVSVTATLGQPMVITMRDSDGFTAAAATNFIAEAAKNRPLNEETIRRQIERIGPTIFTISEIIFNIDENLMVPISEINDTRRRVIQKLEEARLQRFKRRSTSTSGYSIERLLPRNSNNRKQADVVKLVVNTDTIDKVAIALKSGADVIMFGGERFSHSPITGNEYRRAVQLTRESGREIIVSTPRLVKQWQIPEMDEYLNLFTELAPDAISISNLGMLYRARKQGLAVHGDYPLNVYNSIAASEFAVMGCSSLTLSPELTLEQINQLADGVDVDCECIVHGYLTLMVSEHCTVGSYLGNLNSKKCGKQCVGDRYWLKDRKNEVFPIVSDQYCRMHLLNAKELSMAPHVSKLKEAGIQRIRIEGKYTGSANDTDFATTIELYRRILDYGGQSIDTNDIEMLEKAGITRGHYFRGVL